MKNSLNVAIAGATGYVGIQLIKILLKHPKIKIKYLLGNKSAGKKVTYFDKEIKSKSLPIISKLTNIDWKNINIIFTALPNGGAQSIAKKLPKNIKLIDLSGDFRLDDFKEYKKWYGIDHKCKKLINESIYSITEFSKKKINKFRIISCPGCYPTSVQLPLIPLLKKKMIKTDNIIIDSKSGYSGAGKNIMKKHKFKNLFNSVSAYGVGYHKHMIEIDQELSKSSNKKVQVHFTPHLIPMFRGILSTIYVDLKKNINQNKIINLLKKYYKNAKFVKIMKKDQLLSTNDVINTNNCFISVCKSKYKNKIIILSVIDNLIKGGSGQAVQNMNLKFKFPEKEGLA